ncbi:MAG: peroxidase-related enzyme [Candidatus Poribacteria bacterium]|nr:peroxidase-related enzyme [Candidatus Poribacteria bacterium]
MSYLKSQPDETVLLEVFRSYPTLSLPIIEYHEILMRGDSPFTVAERELIAAYVSGLNACQYCHGVHTATAEAFGVSEGLLKGLLEDVDSVEIDAKMIAILRYVKKLTEAPAKMTQADADEVFAAGWDDQALYEAVSVCALFNYMNRLVEGLGIKAGPEYFKVSSQRLAEHGYGGLIKLIQKG